METLINELESLGIHNTKMAEVKILNDGKLEVHKVEIEVVSVDVTKEEKDLMLEEFKELLEISEFENFVTYSFFPKNLIDLHIFPRSSSLDEIWEMFKADWVGQEIPERKCNAIKIIERKKKKAKGF